MSALLAVGLQEVKDELKVDFPDDDALITQCIHTAVEQIEARTQHYLYERVISLHLRGHGELYHYPVKVNSVVNEDAVSVEYKLNPFTLYSKIKTYTDYPTTINAMVGYATKEAIPPSLRSAAIKLAVYLYENRNVELVEIPLEIKMLYRSFVRYATI